MFQRQAYWKNLKGLSNLKEDLDHYAFQKGAFNINAQHSSTNMTPLMEAALQAKNWEFIDQLMEYGADPDIQGPHGKTSVMFILERGGTDFLSFVLDYKADISIKDNDGRIALHYAAAHSPDPGDIYSLLIYPGGRELIDAQDSKGLTPLMLAAVNAREPNPVTRLVKEGADITIRDKDGKTAWDHLQGNEHLKDDTAAIEAVRV